MPKQDLRTWIAEMEMTGQIQKVSGAEREEEIGGILDVYQRAIGNKALLFDDIPGYPSGYRILANVLTSVPRISMTIGLPDQTSPIDLIRLSSWCPAWKSHAARTNTRWQAVSSANRSTLFLAHAPDCRYRRMRKLPSKASLIQ